MISARTPLRILAVITLSLVLSAFGAAGDFTGTYSLGAPSLAGNDVQLTIMFNVANNTSSAVTNATVALHEPKAGRIIYGQVAGVSLSPGHSTHISGSFRVPHALYDSWQRGSSPAMSVSYNDANGNPVQTFVQF